MLQQKRLALINDFTGFGRCSIAVELPLVSALKVQACLVPTAILSVHTGFSKHYLDDYTKHMPAYIKSWQQNNLTFDGIVTGFLGSAAQIEIVIDFISHFRQPNTLIIVDPVMGDNGKLYSSYTPQMCREMRRLLQYADIITPNLTEACTLLDIPYPQNDYATEDTLAEMAYALTRKGPAQVVITGLNAGDYIRNYVYENRQGITIDVERIGEDRSGSGDAFTAIVAASLIKNEPLIKAVEKATDFISRCVAYATKLNLPWNYGLPFEEYLTDLR